jgi:hypothetical protein
MTEFREGDFIKHRTSKGYGFLVHRRGGGIWEAYHPNSNSNPRINTERFFKLADREPTEAELCDFVKWRLTK